MEYNISYSCISHKGKLRTINQDNFICNGDYIKIDDFEIEYPLIGAVSSKTPTFFGVFDGLGGEERGEIASYIAAKTASTIEIGKDIISDLLQFCQKANTDICDNANESGVSAMGTTAAILAFTGNGVTLCNIGDSRIFRFCDGVLEQISKDHVAVSAFGVKLPLSQNLGIPPNELIIEPYLAQGAYNDRDIYLICSDGLTDMVTNEEITEVLGSKTIDEAITELLDRALCKGGRDNITIVLCKIERELSWISRRKQRNLKKEV